MTFRPFKFLQTLSEANAYWGHLSSEANITRLKFVFVNTWMEVNILDEDEWRNDIDSKCQLQEILICYFITSSAFLIALSVADNNAICEVTLWNYRTVAKVYWFNPNNRHSLHAIFWHSVWGWITFISLLPLQWWEWVLAEWFDGEYEKWCDSYAKQICTPPPSRKSFVETFSAGFPVHLSSLGILYVKPILSFSKYKVEANSNHTLHLIS